MFNDAAAIAMFGLFLDMVLNGSGFDLLTAGRQFLLTLIGGAAFGYVLARICGWLIGVLQDSVTTEVTLTIALAYITFVVGNEVLGISGVVATVTAAIVIGTLGRTRVSPGSWEVLKSVWEHLDFWATCLIFVTSAMYVPQALSSFDWGDALNVAVVFAAALFARGLVIWGLLPSFAVIGASEPLSQGYKAVLWWGGMRGAVTIALALATAATEGIPGPLGHMVVSTAIGYVIATLVVNGLTLRPVMNALKLDKLGEHDRAIRNRIRLLARRRVMSELEGVMAVLGPGGEEIIRSVLPNARDALRFADLDPERRLYMALDVWCHHEYEAILGAREKGVLSRRHADTMRHQADRFQQALRSVGAEGYRAEIERHRTVPMTLRLAFRVYRLTGWQRPLTEAISDRLGHLLGETIILSELMKGAKDRGDRLFLHETADELRKMLAARLAHVEAETRSLDRAFPEFSTAMRRRQMALIALGLVESEFRKHLSESTISADVFDDLEGERRDMAGKFARTPDLKLAGAIRKRTAEMLHNVKPGGLGAGLFRKAQAATYLAYPGEWLEMGRFPGKLFCVITGTVQAQCDGTTVALAEGDVFGAGELPDRCHRAQRAMATGYASLALVEAASFVRKPRPHKAKAE